MVAETTVACGRALSDPQLDLYMNYGELLKQVIEERATPISKVFRILLLNPNENRREYVYLGFTILK